MLFSSISFLYYFLPLLLIIYFIVPKKYKNLVILIFSLIFYFYGEPKYIIILILSCIINFYSGILIEKYREKSKFILIISLVYNIGQLLYFKYTNFFLNNINNLFHTNISLLNIIMPIGISFFTFQTISYLVDVYKKDVDASHNILNFSTYVSLFPQLVAGPIVRYKTINNELIDRKNNYEDFSNGVKRFVIGLSKKVLIANVIGELCSSLGNITTTVVSSWMSAIGFTIQIYFDFSGYSDMAIGLGLMLGFHFLENFNYPYISKSITDFWRRWHISLSSFFRDYVYFPLGGNRVSKIKWIRNILIVWLLTGFWHGSAWNFIIWGIYFAIILLLEKTLWGSLLEKTKVFKYFYTLLIVIIGFVIFNSSSINEILISLKNMFYINNIPFNSTETIYYLRSYLVIIIISIISATPLFKNIINLIKTKKIGKVINTLEPVYYIVLLVLVTSFLIDSSFNPFLYFRF